MSKVNSNNSAAEVDDEITNVTGVPKVEDPLRLVAPRMKESPHFKSDRRADTRADSNDRRMMARPSMLLKWRGTMLALVMLAAICAAYLMLYQ